MKKLLTLLALAALVAGCNTISGLGKDIEAAGEGIQRSSGKK
jgi:predicted small secreted protein